MLREWRERRRLSQLDLSSMASVSTRHLSYVETGRSVPSRELILHLADHLDVPHRQRNDLLLAAGYAPAYLDVELGDPMMSDVRQALDALLANSCPHPTLVMDRHWNLVDANEPALAWTAHLGPAVLTDPINVMRATLHPDGLAPRIENLHEVSRHLLDRVRRQLARHPDRELADLLAELESVRRDDADRTGSVVGTLGGTPPGSDAPALPIVIDLGDGPTRYLSVVSTFGSALDVTAAELTIETFYELT